MFSGTLPDWSNSGGGAVHAVDHANVFPTIDDPRDFAVMIWQDNVITQSSGIGGSNDNGTEYQIDFLAGSLVSSLSIPNIGSWWRMIKILLLATWGTFLIIKKFCQKRVK